MYVYMYIYINIHAYISQVFYFSTENIYSYSFNVFAAQTF